MIFGIQTGQFPDVAGDRITLRDLQIINVQGRHLAQGCRLTDFRKVTGRKTIVLKLDPADMQREPCRFRPSSWKIEISDFQFIHDLIPFLTSSIQQP